MGDVILRGHTSSALLSKRIADYAKKKSEDNVCCCLALLFVKKIKILVSRNLRFSSKEGKQSSKPGVEHWNC